MKINSILEFQVGHRNLRTNLITKCQTTKMAKFWWSRSFFIFQISLDFLTGANIVFESRRRCAGLVFQNLAFSGWVSHNTRALYLEISCWNDVTNLWLSFSIPTKKCVKAQTDPYSQSIYPYIAICKVSLKTVSEECL